MIGESIYIKWPLHEDGVATATAQAIERVEDVKRRAEQVATDPDRRDRREDQMCVACFYLRDTVGAVGDTGYRCGICDKLVTVSNTRHIMRLCLRCAKRHKLCVHCGGDVEMKHRRKPRDFGREDG